MNITLIINQFRIFLNTAWTGLPDWIKNKEESRYAIDDWFQANWEALVEAEINQFLAVVYKGVAAV